MHRFFDLLYALTHIDPTNGRWEHKHANDENRYHIMLIDLLFANQLAPPAAYENEDVPWYIYVPGVVFVIGIIIMAAVFLFMMLMIRSFGKRIVRLENERKRLLRANAANNNGRTTTNFGAEAGPVDNSVTINVARLDHTGPLFGGTGDVNTNIDIPPTYHQILPTLSPEMVTRYATITEAEPEDESTAPGEDALGDRPYPLVLYTGNARVDPVPQ